MASSDFFFDDLPIVSSPFTFLNDEFPDLGGLFIDELGDFPLLFPEDTSTNLPPALATGDLVSSIAPSVPATRFSTDQYSPLLTSTNVTNQNDENLFADFFSNQPDNTQGFNECGRQLTDLNLWSRLDELASIPNDHPLTIKEDSTERKTYKSSLVENTRANFVSNNEIFLTGGFLQCIIPPSQHQRVRYVRELEEEALRYITVDNDGVLTLSISGILNDVPPQMSCYLRITRLTLPYGPNGLQLYHPYGIWLNEEDALVHNNALLLPINNLTIQIKKLVLPRLRQNILNQSNQYRVFTRNQFNNDNFHTIVRQKASAIINEYQLRCSIVHFQVILVDGNNCVHPTDLQCQTQSIYEYEGKELTNLMLMTRHTNRKKCPATKRLQKPNEKQMVKKKLRPEEPPPLV